MAGLAWAVVAGVVVGAIGIALELNSHRIKPVLWRWRDTTRARLSE